MRCENCKKFITNPILKCPYCGTDIPEEALASFRKEASEIEAQDAIIRKTWKKYFRLSLLSIAVGILVILPLTLYVGLKNGLNWLPWLGIGLWVLSFVYFGFIKGGVRCPFCGALLGNSGGKYCPHCKSQYRD